MALPENINFTGIDILTLIPQRPPMVMIDKLVSCDDTTTITSLVVGRENIFFSEGYLREPGLIENIAQTAAAGAGYRMLSSVKDGIVPMGFIGAVKNLIIHRLPAEGEELTTEIKVTHEVFDAAIVFGNIKSNSKFVAECEMKIFTKSSN